MSNKRKSLHGAGSDPINRGCKLEEVTDENTNATNKPVLEHANGVKLDGEGGGFAEEELG